MVDRPIRSLGDVPGSHIFPVEKYGAKGDGVTDDSAAVTAALAAAAAAGGGTVQFAARTYRILSQIVMPGTLGKQVSLTLAGAGSRKNGVETSSNVLGGTVLDLHYQGTGAKIVSGNYGPFGMCDLHLTQTVSAADTTPFVLNTHSTPHIERVSVTGHSTLSLQTCIQDAFVFGNTGGTADNPPWFSGYGGYVRDCAFDRIRSGVVGRKACNAFYIANNTWSWECGSNNTQGAIDFDGTGDQAAANVFVNNIIECRGYPYAIRLAGSHGNMFYGTGFWDDTPVLLACVKMENGSYGNTFIGTQVGSIPSSKWVTGSTNYTWLGGGGFERLGVNIGAPEDALHIRKTSMVPYTWFGDTVGILLQNLSNAAGNFTSVINKNSAGSVVAGMFFKNIDHWLSGAIDFCTRNENEYTIRMRIDHLGRIIMGKDNTQTPAAGALLTLNSTTQGFAPPRMTTAERNAIATPAAGLMVYNTSTNTVDFFNGTVWKQIAGV